MAYRSPRPAPAALLGPTRDGIYGLDVARVSPQHSTGGRRRSANGRGVCGGRCLRDTRGMKLYFAGPLFTTPSEPGMPRWRLLCVLPGTRSSCRRNRSRAGMARDLRHGCRRDRLGGWTRRDHGRPRSRFGDSLGGRVRVRGEETDRAGPQRPPHARGQHRRLQPDADPCGNDQGRPPAGRRPRSSVPSSTRSSGSRPVGPDVP